MDLGLIFKLATLLPSLIQAVQTIMASQEGKTIDHAIHELIQHNTPGQPNSPSLSPTSQAIDFQAPKG